MPAASANRGTSPGRARDWAPRFWEGCNFPAWVSLLARNRFAVDLSHLYIAVIVTFVSMVHTVLRLVQEARYRGRVSRTPVAQAPIFIIGHWRTGTTLLHELLILDERHTFPTTYQCLAPNHFLLTERFFARHVRFLLPSRRPMDNMAAGWERPQEDEFGLCMLGLPSPYLTIAFPNRPPACAEYLDLRGLSPGARARWKRVFRRFLQEITFTDPRRLVLKSPPHTCRIPVLRQMFPDARFVHVVRDPYVVFPSTVNLWRKLYEKHGLQRPTLARLEDEVFDTFLRLYERLEGTRRLVPPGRFFEVRYEDLVRDPVGRMRALYESLELGGFEQVRPRLEDYVKHMAGYETNRYDLPDALCERITQRWGDVIRRLGYPLRTSRGPVTAEGCSRSAAGC
jgi:hypothetical protein